MGQGWEEWVGLEASFSKHHQPWPTHLTQPASGKAFISALPAWGFNPRLKAAIAGGYRLAQCPHTFLLGANAEHMGVDELSQQPSVGKDLHALAPPLNVGARFRAHCRWKAHPVCEHAANPSLMGNLPAVSSSPLLLEEGKGPPNQERLGFLQPLSFPTDTQIKPELAYLSWRCLWTRLWLLYRDQPPHDKCLPPSAAHFPQARCALVPADQAVCCSPCRNDLSDGAVSSVPPSSTLYTNWCADKFCLNRKNYFSITVIFPFSPIILLCILHCALGPTEPQNNVRLLSEQQY